MGLRSCLIIAGEKSGEEHALSFLTELKARVPHCDFFGVGGDELESEGMELLYHLKDFSSWGFSEVVGKIPFYFKALKKIEKEVVSRQCKVAILIDFQDFNLRLAKKLKKRGVKVLYYVAPQAWVWKAKRAMILEECVHTLFTIIPFERRWFEDRGVSRVCSVPHPLLSTYGHELTKKKNNKNFSQINNQMNLLCLPGSRKFEVAELLPIFIESVKELQKLKMVKTSIVISSNIPMSLYEPYLDFFDDIYTNESLVTALHCADMAIAASGTVTLATALFSIPTVVTYKGSLLNEFIYYTFLSYSGPIALANLVHNQNVFPELTQDACSSFNIVKECLMFLSSEESYNNTLHLLGKTKEILAGENISVGEYMGKVVEAEYDF